MAGINQSRIFPPCNVKNIAINGNLSPTSDVSGSLLDFALTCNQGLTVFRTRELTTDSPFSYCVGTVFVRADDFKIVAYDLQSSKVSTNRKTGGMSSWEGWIPLVTNNDFTNKTVINNRGIVTTNADQPLALWIDTTLKTITLYLNGTEIGIINYT